MKGGIFTGERWEAYSQLLFLRARYYEPKTGRFLSRDPLRGDYTQPLTLHGWSYAKENPIRFVDRLGLFPTEGDIREGNAEFTCACGWIDWNHVKKSDEVAYALVDDLKYAAQHMRYDPFLLDDRWGIYVGISLGWRDFNLDLFGHEAVVRHSELSTEDRRTSLASSISMDANEHFEENQRRWGMGSSYYSEEDLLSDMLGFYVGLERFKNVGVSSDQVKQRILSLCGSVGKDKSIDVLKGTYANGANALLGWKNWSPRCVELTGSDSCLCNGTSRKWPAEFAALASRREFPSPDGTWWWYRGWSEDGDLVQTERPRIYRFLDEEPWLIPTPPPSGTPPPFGTPVP